MNESFSTNSVAHTRHLAALIEKQLHDNEALREWAGIPEAFDLVLDEGSPTYGRAWRLHYRKTDPADHGPNEGPGAQYAARFTDPGGYLGFSKREACEKMIDIRRALFDIADILDRQDITP